MKMLSTIPFAGFYSSIHSECLDDALRSYYENDGLYKHASAAINWGKVYHQYAKAYVDNRADHFGIRMEFESFKSPKEYNFSTDIIYVLIELKQVEAMRNAISDEALNELIHEKFTSRSGFISFYANDLAEWPTDLARWDHNQVGTLVEAFMRAHSSDEECALEMDCMYEWLYTANPIAERLDRIDMYLQDRAYR